MVAVPVSPVVPKCRWSLCVVVPCQQTKTSRDELSQRLGHTPFVRGFVPFSAKSATRNLGAADRPNFCAPGERALDYSPFSWGTSDCLHSAPARVLTSTPGLPNHESVAT